MSTKINKRPKNRTRKPLTLNQKVEMIKLSDTGLTKSAVSRILMAPLSTVCDVINSKEKVMRQLAEASLVIVPEKKENNFIMDMEKQLVMWIMDLVKHNAHISKKMIESKASELLNSMKAGKGKDAEIEKFKANKDWSELFMRRNLPSKMQLCDDDNETTVTPEINVSNPENQTYDENSVPQDVTPVPIEEQGPYTLQHENHPFLVLKSLSEDESFMDVTLTAQGKPIKAHKSVLSAMSLYFNNVLKTNPSPHPIIVMPLDVTFQELKNIIGYIYKGETTMDPTDLKSFLKAADALQVMGLMSTEADAICAHVQETPQAPPTVSPPSKGSRKKKKRKRVPSYSESDHSPDEEEMLAGNGDIIMVKEELNDEIQNHQEILLNETPEFEPAPSLKNESMAKRQILAQFSFPSTSSAGGRVTVNNAHFGDNNGDSVITEILPFQCPYCYQLHRPKQKLQFHLGLEHPNRNSHMCKCARVFTTTNLLSRHEKKCAVLLKKKGNT